MVVHPVPLVLSAALLAGQTAPPALPAPPVITVSPPRGGSVRSSPALLKMTPGEVRCGDRVVTPLSASPSQIVGIFAVPAVRQPGTTLTFAIDASGRTTGIGLPAGTPVYGGISADLAPAVASWRFAPGQAQSGCTVRFTAEAATVADAPEAWIYAYIALPHDRGIAEAEVRQRMAALSGTCLSGGAPAVRLRAYPDFDAIPQAPGTLNYAMIRHDIDASGRPRNIRVVGGDGNRALEAAAMKAIGDSRFEPGAREGCLYPYYRRQPEPLAAPAMPDRDSFPENAACDANGWERPPVLRFPRPFARRKIEGWAVIGYDVAPWGATGNVKVLASAPADAFGVAGADIVRISKRRPTETGATGCVTRVVFRMPRKGEPPLPDQPEPPPPF